SMVNGMIPLLVVGSFVAGGVLPGKGGVDSLAPAPAGRAAAQQAPQAQDFCKKRRPLSARHLCALAHRGRYAVGGRVNAAPPARELSRSLANFRPYCAGQHATQMRMPLYQTMPAIAPAIA